MADVLLFGGGRSFFSGRIPEALRYLLSSAQAAGEPGAVERLLLEARRRWPEQPDAHIALYKFYFLLMRYREAEQGVRLAMHHAARAGGFARHYGGLNRYSADWNAHEGAARWYLFNLKALGVVRLRRGRVIQARAVLEKLLMLDPMDEIGGAAFLQIARSFEEEP